MNYETAREGSVIIALYRRLAVAMIVAYDTSRIRAPGRSVAHSVDVAVSNARVSWAGATVARWARASSLYRWFTAEPDPTVVVIDLRETYTVGPALVVLDWFVTRLAGHRKTSRFGGGVDTVAEMFARQPIRTVSILFLVAILSETTISTIVGSLSSTTLGSRALIAALALAGTRVRLSWAECRETRAYRGLAALLAPPEPPTDAPTDDRRDHE